ncbi:hypothetical protein Fmac_012248 [Flemingia macrophylla]|uniref:Reverse transcriptase Ty1/copia-type domain-containing protein n=1 Tax=Flemingia macrophylla TaxID=520843 RepID=A0ABD1MQK9_9FABA
MLTKSMHIPRCWYKKFDSFIIILGYNGLSSNHYTYYTYYNRFNEKDFIILLCVDDMLVVGPNKDRIQELKTQLARDFDIKDLGLANKIIGMKIPSYRKIMKIGLFFEELFIESIVVLQYARL